MSNYSDGKLKLSVEQVPESSVRMLWHHDYWDGPLSGACMFNNERLWFLCFDESHGEDWCRKFVLLRLNEEQWKDIDFRHCLFQDYVGMHTDYDEKGNRSIGHDLKPRVESNHDKFYDWAKENPSEEPEGEEVAWYRNPCDKE
jgi:hypothetical protein